jgi:hypothetical protein
MQCHGCRVPLQAVGGAPEDQSTHGGGCTDGGYARQNRYRAGTGLRSGFDPAIAKGLAEAPKPARDKIMSWVKEDVVTGDIKFTDGWMVTTKTAD